MVVFKYPVFRSISKAARLKRKRIVRLHIQHKANFLVRFHDLYCFYKNQRSRHKPPIVLYLNNIFPPARSHSQVCIPSHSLVFRRNHQPVNTEGTEPRSPWLRAAIIADHKFIIQTGEGSMV